MKEPLYLTIARKQLGVAEIPGKEHSATILSWLQLLKAWWKDDEAPWCGVFVGYCLKAAGFPIPKLYMRAKAWLEYGEEIKAPCLGAIVVFERKGGGHVGFVVGVDYANRILVLGGNQGNRVSIAAFETSRIVGYRLPLGEEAQPLPRLSLSASLSENEA